MTDYWGSISKSFLCQRRTINLLKYCKCKHEYGAAAFDGSGQLVFVKKTKFFYEGNLFINVPVITIHIHHYVSSINPLHLGRNWERYLKQNASPQLAL